MSTAPWPEQTNKTGNKRGALDFVATVKPTSALTLLLPNYDWGHEETAAAGNETTLWQGFAAVANYAFTDRASPDHPAPVRAGGVPARRVDEGERLPG